MEMHTRDSLRALHGLELPPSRQRSGGWIRELLPHCLRSYRHLVDQIRVRRALAELRRYEDHRLDDIGVDRDTIERLIRGEPPTKLADGEPISLHEDKRL